MRDLTLLIKPAGPDCNLRCGHCFYLGKAALFRGDERHRMGDEVLAALLRNYLSLDQTAFGFCWQGGEPTLMGLPFFQRVTALQASLARRGSVINNSVQTNATLIDEGLARHFADYRFLVGVSLDGPPRLHDAQRPTRKGGGTHERVLTGLSLLRRHGAVCTAVCLVSRLGADRPRDLYRYLRDLDFADLQFIPLVDDGARRTGRPLAVSGKQWGAFLCGVFDAWWPEDVGRISVRLFDAIAAKLACGHDQLCTLAADCRHYLVIEHDGSIFPCDFYVDEELRLGSVLTDDLAEVRDGAAWRAFGAVKQAAPPACHECEHWALCQGDCPANRPPGRPSRLCDGWRRFFAHAGPRLRELAVLAGARRAAEAAADLPFKPPPAPPS